MILYILHGKMCPLSVLILSQLLSHSLPVFGDPDNRKLSGRISKIYDLSLQIKMAAQLKR